MLLSSKSIISFTTVNIVKLRQAGGSNAHVVRRVSKFNEFACKRDQWKIDHTYIGVLLGAMLLEFNHCALELKVGWVLTRSKIPIVLPMVSC